MKAIRTLAAVLSAALFMVSVAPAARGDEACQRLDIEDAVKLALANNPVIKQAVQDAKAAQSRVMETRAGLLPSISASGMYIFTHQVPSFYIAANSFGKGFPPSSLTATLDSTYDYNAGFNGSWTLFAGGTFWNNYSASRDLYNASSYTEQDTILDTVYQVKAAYYNLLLATDSVSVIQNSIELAREQYKNAQSRFEAGSVSKLDVLNAKVSLSNLQPPLLVAQNDIKTAMLNLMNLMGVKFTGGICGNGNIPMPASPTDPAALRAYAVQNNFQLKAIDKQIAASKYYKKAAYGGFSPALSLNGNYNWLTNDFSGAWQPVYQGALVLMIPLFNGGVDVGRVREADANYYKALFIKKQIRFNVGVAVQSAYFDANVAQEALAAAKDAMTTAQEAVSTAQEEYKVGMAINTDVIGANRGLRDAQLDYIKAKYSYLTAMARLDRVMGKTTY